MHVGLAIRSISAAYIIGMHMIIPGYRTFGSKICGLAAINLLSGTPYFWDMLYNVSPLLTLYNCPLQLDGKEEGMQITWPGYITSGLVICGLAARRTLRDIPYWFAIIYKVSPALMVYI